MNVIKQDTFPAAVMQAAYDAYLGGNFNYEQMALELDVPVKVIQRWVTEGGWKERKLELDREILEQSDLEYRKFVSRNRTPVAERHARVAGMLEEALEKQISEIKAAIENGTLEEKYVGSTLKRLAEALSPVTGVSARAVGMSDKVTIMETAGAAGTQPLVVINTVPQVSRSREPVTIDVTDA